jgi:hypothetical protein
MRVSGILVEQSVRDRLPSLSMGTCKATTYRGTIRDRSLSLPVEPLRPSKRCRISRLQRAHLVRVPTRTIEEGRRRWLVQARQSEPVRRRARPLQEQSHDYRGPSYAPEEGEQAAGVGLTLASDAPHDPYEREQRGQ